MELIISMRKFLVIIFLLIVSASCAGNNIKGSSNYIYGTNNDVVGNSNVQITHNVDVKGNNNNLVGANY